MDPSDPAYQFHRSILSQAEQAWREGDDAGLAQLLRGSRKGASPAQATRYKVLEGLLQGKILLSRGLVMRGFQAHCPKASAILELPGIQAFHLDAPYQLELVLRAAEGQKGAFGEQNSLSLLVVEGSYVDTLVSGGQIRRTFPLTLRVPGRVELGPEGWRMALPGPGLPSSQVLIRKVQLRGQLYCKGIVWQGVEVPLTKIPLEPLAFFLLPKGTEAVQKDPLRTLKLAVATPLKKGPHLLVATFLCGLKPETRKAAKKILASALAEENLAAESLLRRCFRLLTWAAEKKKGLESWEGFWKNPRQETN